MKKIFITIPSFNEADNISFVTKKIDKGLSRYFPEYSGFLINADSNSSDNTIKQFKSTITKANKISLKCPKGKIGKGYGINIGFKYGFMRRGYYFATIDADLKSINQNWLKKLLKPIVCDNVDFVVPLYSRNRYEGNGTNHFSSPVIYACFGYDLVQPIAGDFSLSRRLVEAVIDSFSIPDDYLYGVDSLISLTALLKGYEIKQQRLGKKIHNPSFGKIVPIFNGEACSTFYLLNKNRKKILDTIKKRKSVTLCPSKIADDDYTSKPNVNKINNLNNFAASEIIKYNYKKITGSDYNKLLKSTHLAIDTRTWANILTDFLNKLLTNELKYKDILFLTQSITPLYLLRVLTYFKEIDNKSEREADSIIKLQKKMIRYALLTKLSH